MDIYFSVPGCPQKALGQVHWRDAIRGQSMDECFLVEFVSLFRKPKCQVWRSAIYLHLWVRRRHSKSADWSDWMTRSTECSVETEINKNDSCVLLWWHFDCDIKLKGRFNQTDRQKEQVKNVREGLTMISVLTGYHLSVFEFQLIYVQTVQARNVSYFICLMYPNFYMWCNCGVSLCLHRRRSGHGTRAKWWWCRIPFTGKLDLSFFYLFF